MKDRTEFATTTDLLHYIYDTFKDRIDGSFHTTLWHTMIDGGLVGEMICFYPVINVGTWMVTVATVDQPGYNLTGCGFKEKLPFSKMVDLCNEINLLAFGHNATTCAHIVTSSMKQPS